MLTSEDVVLDVRGLRMRYGTTEVLRGVDFHARQGEVLCLLGPNGAGKTTTIEILEGFRMRSSGRVAVLGVDPARGDERWRARLGIVPQSWRDHGKWRVRELLAHLGRYYSRYATDTIARPWDTDDLVAAVGLTVHGLFTRHGDEIRDLEVRRTSLEDTYLTLVRHAESGAHDEREAAR